VYTPVQGILNLVMDASTYFYGGKRARHSLFGLNISAELPMGTHNTVVMKKLMMKKPSG